MVRESNLQRMRFGRWQVHKLHEILQRSGKMGHAQTICIFNLIYKEPAHPNYL